MNVANTGDTIHLRKTAPEGWSWTKTNKRRIRKEAKGLKDPKTFITSETIDRTIDILITQFQNITDLSTPRRKT